MKDSNWQRVSRRHPCRICKKQDFCTFNESLGLARCMRSESERPSTGGGWLHRIDCASVVARPVAPPVPAKSDADYAAIWDPRAKQWFSNQIATIERLSKILGVSHDALDMLRVGYNEREKCWTFPERNHLGQIVGVTRRFEDGKKLCAVGSKRGLTFIDDWQDWPGPCYLVEGGSDVAAGLTIGLCVVGRPSNVGGVEYLGKLLAGFDRPIIVVGERDMRPHTALSEAMQVGHDEDCMGCVRCWPGLYGCERTAEELRKKIGKDVSFVFPPVGSKDMRAWLNSQPEDTDLFDAWNSNEPF